MEASQPHIDAQRVIFGRHIALIEMAVALSGMLAIIAA